MSESQTGVLQSQDQLIGIERIFQQPNISFIQVKKDFSHNIYRGCPYSCFEYCTYPITQGRKAFQEEIDAFLVKLKAYSEKYKGAHLVFRDPVFSINIEKSKMLLEAIGNANLISHFLLSYT